MTGKTWLTRKGRYKGGRPFDKCSLHALLTNVIYLGKIRHKDQIYDGQHEPIIDPSVFDSLASSIRSIRGSLVDLVSPDRYLCTDPE